MMHNKQGQTLPWPAAAAETERFRLAFHGGFPFSICRYMRKMEVYFEDLVTERERIDVLHDRVTTLLEGLIRQFARVGMDGVFFCEDLDVQDRLLMSPVMWRDIFRPLYKRLTGTAHDAGIKILHHSCGYNIDLVDDLCEAGTTQGTSRGWADKCCPNLAFRGVFVRPLRRLNSKGHEELVGVDVLQLQVELLRLIPFRRGA